MELKSLSDTRQLAEDIAPKLAKTPILCLYGEIGSGKTTFTKYLAEALGLDNFRIKSPTYSYIRRYQLPTKDRDLYHIDLYRTDHLDELMIHEINEIIENGRHIVIIEWADRLAEILPKTRIDLHFSYKEGEVRHVLVSQ